MDVRDIVVGTCDGTGAAINVCLGFVPSYVKVWNMESATFEKMEWLDQMSVITAIDEGVVVTGTSTFTRAAVATNGISAYAGGDDLIYDGVTDNQWENAAGTVVEEVYVNGQYKRAVTGDAAYQCIGDAIQPNLIDGSKVKSTPGFIIGADANLNVNGEQLAWIAYR